MKDCYNRAMNKITASEDFEQKVKERLIREQARIDATKTTAAPKSRFNMLVAASTAAVILLTIVLSQFSISKLTDKNSIYQTEYADVAQTSNKGYSTFSVAEDMSYRLTSAENTIKYQSNIYFTFEGFDEYGIDLRESCIVFNTALDKNYTLANFFFDYYNIITQQNGYTLIENGILDSFFGIKDNSNQMLSVYDELRGEIVDLDSVRMEEYWDLEDIRFTVKVSEL